MKLYERIENNNFDEIDRNRAIELIEGGNGHLVYNENYFKLQKENEELKEELKEENELNKIIKDTKLDELFCRRNGKKVEQAIKLRDELLKLPECKLYGIKKCKKSVVLITKEEVIPVQKVKDKIKEILNNGEYRIIFEGDAEFPDEATCIDAQKYIKLEKLQELLEGRKENERK